MKMSGRTQKATKGVFKEDTYSERMKARRNQAYKSHNLHPKRDIGIYPEVSAVTKLAPIT